MISDVVSMRVFHHVFHHENPRVLMLKSHGFHPSPTPTQNPPQTAPRRMYHTPGSFGTGVWSCARAQLGPMGAKFSAYSRLGTSGHLWLAQEI